MVSHHIILFVNTYQIARSILGIVMRILGNEELQTKQTDKTRNG